MKKNNYLLFMLPLFLIHSLTTNAGWFTDVRNKFSSINERLQPYRDGLIGTGNLGLALGFCWLGSKVMGSQGGDIIAGTTSMGLIGATLFGYKYWQHSKQLDNIQITLEKSNNANSLEPKDFRFCTWRKIALDQIAWKNISDVTTNLSAVAGQLEKDTKSDFVKIFDKSGKKIEAKCACADDVRAAIEREQRELEQYLQCIDGLASTAQLFLAEFEQFNDLKDICNGAQRPFDSAASHKKIIAIANQLLILYNCDEILNTVERAAKNKVLNRTNIVNFSRFTLAPQYKKAADVYSIVLKSYVRLLAVKEAARQLKFKQSDKTSADQLLESGRILVNDIIREQPLVNGDGQKKQQQIYRLIKLQNKLKKLRDKLTVSNAEIIDKVLLTLQAIGQQVHENPQSVMILLNAVKTQLNEIKN